MELFKDGGTATTRIGFVNRNSQLCTGHRGTLGTAHGQFAYRLMCLAVDCGHLYGVNGTDVFQRRCPKCQGGDPAIPY